MKPKIKLIDVFMSFILFFAIRFSFEEGIAPRICAAKNYDILQTGSGIAFSLIFVFMILFFLIFHGSEKRRALKITAVLSSMILIVAALISFKTVTVSMSDNLVTERKFWGLESQTYKLDELEKAELSAVGANSKWKITTLEYELFFPGENSVKLTLSDCHYKAPESSIEEFDKKISDKRTVKDDLSECVNEIRNEPENFYGYFHNLK